MLPLIPFGAFHHSQSYHPPLSVTLPKRLPASLAIRPIAFSFFCSAEHTELLPRHYYTPLFERSTSLPSVALVYPISSGRLRLDRDLHFTTVATIRALERGKAKYKEEKQAKVLLTLDKHWTCRFDFPAPPGLHSYSPFSRIISASHSCPTGRLFAATGACASTSYNTLFPSFSAVDILNNKRLRFQSRLQPHHLSPASSPPLLVRGHWSRHLPYTHDNFFDYLKNIFKPPQRNLSFIYLIAQIRDDTPGSVSFQHGTRRLWYYRSKEAWCSSTTAVHSIKRFWESHTTWYYDSSKRTKYSSVVAS